MAVLEQERVIIDTAAVPAFRRRELAQSVLTSLEQALAVPGAEEEFQVWLEDYRNKKRTAKAARRKE